jgi:AraC family transcriptional activator of pobA
MILRYNKPRTNSEMRLLYNEPEFDRVFYGKDRKDKLLTIAWNKGEDQTVRIDDVEYAFPSNTVLCLMINETFHFPDSWSIVAWQFNRDFYCIVDHDREVSCVGFLFYGSSQKMFIHLDKKEQRKLELLFQVFLDEFDDNDHIQGEMMQALLKRLIIIITRLAKRQYLSAETLTGEKLDIIRAYNLLVEKNYRREHQVKYYADQLNRSPKTLSNLFALYNHKSPLQVIQERVLQEAKRLLFYTDKSAKEIAGELGFEDATHFSKFFKKKIGNTPLEFRKESVTGK